jgi:hypothetical protein
MRRRWTIQVAVIWRRQGGTAAVTRRPRQVFELTQAARGMAIPSRPPHGGKQRGAGTGSPKHDEWFRAPFEAKLSGDQLQLANEELQSRYALRDIKEVEVHYDVRLDDPAKGRRISGIVLTSLGLASIAAGFVLLGTVRDTHGAAPVFLVAVPPLTLGTVAAAIGIPLWVAGSPDQTAVPPTSPTTAPKVYGTALRWAF